MHIVCFNYVSLKVNFFLHLLMNISIFFEYNFKPHSYKYRKE